MEALNSVPFEVFLVLQTVFLSVVMIGAIVSRWVLHLSKLGACLFGGVLGSLAGFLLATSPWVLLMVESHKSWPKLKFWPYRGNYSGLFVASLCGSLAGFFFGCFVVHAWIVSKRTKNPRALNDSQI